MLSPAAAPVPCSVFGTVAAIGDAWSWLILREAVLDEVDGFEAFHDRLGIARSTLSARLEHLTAHGVLGRTGRSYRPTERGSDFFGCLMTAMAWGDRWVSKQSGPPMVIRHKACGHKTKAQITCSSCGEALSADEVRIFPGPGARQGWGTPWDKLPRARSKRTAASRREARNQQPSGGL